MNTERLRYPTHVSNLIKEIRQSDNPTNALMSNRHLIFSDSTLYYIFINLGYSPDQGIFTRTISKDQALRIIDAEYRDLEIELMGIHQLHDSETDSSLGRGIIEEFKRAFEEWGGQEISNPSTFGLQSPKFDYKPLPKLTSRGSRGLKALSIRVRDIVKDKVKTTYKEVADIMIQELDIMNRPEPEKNEKNIRRRVYDALNVLIATGLVAKCNRYVYWGEAKNSQSLQENDITSGKVLQKRQELESLALKLQAMRNLIKRNKIAQSHTEKIYFPFIVVATEERESNQQFVEIDDMNTQVHLRFTETIKILGDVDIIALLNLRGNNSEFFINEEITKLLKCKISN